MKTRSWKFGVSGLALTAALAAGAVMAPGAAMAQTASAAAPMATNKVNLDIPAGPLSDALRQLADASGVQLLYPSALTEGLRTPGLHGSYTVADAISRLLAGTGLSYRFTGASTVTLEPPPVAGARTLGAVQVEGVQNEGFAALGGFGAGAGSNGGSDPTATEGTGSLTTNGATVASKTPQSLKETPQSVTVITQERIKQQNLTDLTSALQYTPGVTVESLDSVENVFFSRGFQITTFRIDGGSALDLGTTTFYETTPNLAEYDNVQVLRGSDALFGGAAAPGGVVSLTRKRPLDHEQVLGDVDAGSWNNYLVQADVTGPIAYDGHLRARLVVNDQDRDFFYETAHQNKAFVYGVVEGDLGPNTIARAGFSYERQNNTGWNFFGLPRYSDGGDLHLSRSTNLSASWDHWNFSTPEFFAALEHNFNSNWGLKANFTNSDQYSSVVEGNDTGLIYINNPAKSTYKQRFSTESENSTFQYDADVTLNGSFNLFGLKQSIIVGSDYSQSDASSTLKESKKSIPINVFSFNPSILGSAPIFPQYYNITSPTNDTKQWGAYATINIQPIENFHIVGGVKLSNYWYDAVSDDYLGQPSPLAIESTKNGASGVLTPYAAATYDVTRDITLYASYADIFQAQGEYLDPAGKPLPPVTGVTYETGIKGAFNGGKLNTSLALYYTDESNQALAYPGACLVGSYCYLNAGVVISQGVDLEITGQLLPGWQAQVGYTYNDNRENKAFLNDGYGNGLNSTYTTQQPKHQLKLWTTYTPTGRFNQWTIGGGLRLESARYSAGSVCSVELNTTTGRCPTNIYVPFAFTQPLYTVLDLRVAYKFNSHWQAALNLTNIADTRYYTTVGTSQSGNIYGEPRAFMFSIRAAY